MSAGATNKTLNMYLNVLKNYFKLNRVYRIKWCHYFKRK